MEEGTSVLPLEVDSLTSGRRAAIYLKNSCMLTPVFALTYLKRTLFFSASSFPSASLMSLSSRSILLARRAMMTPYPL